MHSAPHTLLKEVQQHSVLSSTTAHPTILPTSRVCHRATLSSPLSKLCVTKSPPELRNLRHVQPPPVVHTQRRADTLCHSVDALAASCKHAHGSVGMGTEQLIAKHASCRLACCEALKGPRHYHDQHKDKHRNPPYSYQQWQSH